MRSAYFKELEKVSFEDIKSRIGASDEEVKDMIDSLQYNKRKIVRPYIYGDDEEESDSNQYEFYSFNFVGTVVYKNIVIKCYPKYLNQEYSDIEKDEILKNIIQVLKKYGQSENAVIGIKIDSQKDQFNFLSFIYFMLTDYLENGLYYNQKMSYEINGEGEVDWDKTVNETTAFIVNQRPIYFDMITRYDTHNERDFYRQMHMYVITVCSKILTRTGLSHILSLPVIEFEIDELLFTDKDYVLNQIERELDVQFVSRKQIVLKSLYAYFSKSYDTEDFTNIGLFGTMNFNLVWEKTCAFVLNNQLHSKIGDIGEINKGVLAVELRKKTLNQLIPYPYWISNSATKEAEYQKARKTIQLDIVSVFESDNSRYFVIWDAKYYNLLLTNDRLERNPGVEDVIKQYVYYLAFVDFINNQGFDYSYNVLLFPSEFSNVELIGKVDLEFVRKALGVTDILLLNMPAKLIFDMYLEEKMLDVAKAVDFALISKY